MDEPLTEEAAEFLRAHSGITVNQESVTAAAAWHEARLARDLAALAERPLDLDGVPHAARVLAALGPGLHPLVLASFFTDPRADLLVDGAAVSIRDWLVSGGDPAPVLRYAEAFLVLG